VRVFKNDDAEIARSSSSTPVEVTGVAVALRMGGVQPERKKRSVAAGTKPARVVVRCTVPS